MSSVDLCFVMDCTGSMGSYIAAAKNDITATVRRVADEVPDVDFNYGFVAYRDWCDGDKRIEAFPFSADITAFQSFVGSLAATGGGDYPEDVLGGLWRCTEMEWSSDTRVLFHVFDAPPHGRPRFHGNPSDDHPSGHSSDKPLETILASFRELDLDYYMCALNNDLDKMVNVFKECARTPEVAYESIERRNEIDLSKIMSDVAEAVLESMAVRVSRRGRRHAERRVKPMGKTNSYKVFCGIDFGTHGSAYAFCTPTDTDPRVEQNWNDSSGDVKTLTNLLLGPKKKCVPGPDGFGAAALECYLDMTPEDQKKHFFFRRFKMALYEGSLGEDERDEKVDVESRIRAANGKAVRSEIVLVEALKFMVNHVMEQIRERYDDVTDISDVQWILTVPAIWSQKSRKMMERCAYRAGVPKTKHDQLMVVLEPECASVVARSGLGLEVGDCYMLVDLGGGTVDIACHELVTRTKLKEIHEPSGGPWGATYIDDEWLHFLRVVFGTDVMDQVEEEVNSAQPGLIEELIQDFNNAKQRATLKEASRNVRVSPLRNILGDVFGSGANINEHLSGVTYRGVTGGMTFRRGMLTLSREVWDKLFGIVVDPIIEHIRCLLEIDDLGRRIQTLCLVGGFAQSDILMHRLRDSFPDRRIYRPDKPILAVVQGAAKFGCMPTSICERRAPMTIGIGIRAEWNEVTDAGRKKIRDRIAHMDCVDGVFFPFVTRGQPIPADMEPIVHYFEATRDKFVIQVYQSEEAPAPRFAPETPLTTIGPLEYPEEFDRDYDILVQFDFSGRLITVKVQFGESDPVEVDLDFGLGD